MTTQFLSTTEKDLDTAASYLKNGELVGIPTETVYGLAADALNPRAVAAIFKAKGRPQDNPLIVHIAKFEELASLVSSIPEKAVALAKAYWPGPLTMIFPRAACIPQEVCAGLNTVAVRMPAHPVAQELIRRSGCPLAAPSANLSGLPSPTTAARVMEDMQGRIAAVVDGGECSVGVESTVVDMTRDIPRLLRPGGITPAMIRAVIGEIEIDPAVTHQLTEGAVAASPGMKYTHYSPNARVVIIKADQDTYCRYVNSHAGEGVFALCFREDVDKLSVPTVSYGSRNDSREQAHCLFDALRQLDEQGAHIAYAAAPKENELSLAIYNRLLRAAGFEVITPRPLIIGLTGPSGAGKSVVARKLTENPSIECIDMDLLSREITLPNSPTLKALVDEFTADILNHDGSLNRKKLAEIAFATPEGTESLNRITHPAIWCETERRLNDFSLNNNVKAVLLDAPLLLESGMDSLCDKVLVVTAPKNVRIDRICRRDGISPELAELRIMRQPSDEYYADKADFVVQNTVETEKLPVLLQSVQAQVARWLENA